MISCRIQRILTRKRAVTSSSDKKPYVIFEYRSVASFGIAFPALSSPHDHSSIAFGLLSGWTSHTKKSRPHRQFGEERDFHPHYASLNSIQSICKPGLVKSSFTS